MTTQIFTSIISSVSTAGILYIVRVAYKIRKAVATVVAEHRFLMRAMVVVLEHLNLRV